MKDKVTVMALDQTTMHLLHDTVVFDRPVKPDHLAAFVADPNHDLVFAMHGKEVIGFASGNKLLHPDQEPLFFVNEVGVEEPWRNLGIGARLTSALLERARANGCEGIWLATEDHNAPARALYQKLGARETTGIVVYDWDGAMDEA